MKFVSLILVFCLNLILVNTYDKTKQFILVGFGNYSKITSSFYIYMNKYNQFQNYSNLNLTISIEDQNRTEENITCQYLEGKEENNNEMVYICSFDQIYINATKIALKNYDLYFYTNETFYKKINESDIIITELADKTKDKIIDQVDSLDYKVFDLEKISLSDKTFILKGKKELNISQTTGTLNLTEKEYKCTLSSQNIKFDASNDDINEHLNSKIIYESKKPIILIVSNDNETDSAYYKKNSTFELMGFGNYTPPSNDKNATTTAYFRGSGHKIKYPKQYIKFKATILYEKLRYLSEDKFEAKGKKREEITDGFIIYDITFLDTAGKNITSINITDNYQFSDDENFANSETFEDIDKELHDPTNKLIIIPEEISMKESWGNETNSFYFNFTLDKELNLANQNAIINYKHYNENISYEKSKREEITCSIEDLSNKKYKIICTPKKSVYGYVRSLIITVQEKKRRNLLRNLEDITNRTLYGPSESEEIIKYTQTNISFQKKSNKLSAGAIAGIVIGCVVVTAAVIVTALFVNRNKVVPPPKPPEGNFPNSTANINKNV